ncbi:MAG: acyl-CoA desaturase [Bacteroidetes bacterium]|nr:acyl-CoA desaturase [Bacteroidota bacterium]
MLIIFSFLIIHWYLSLFSQTFFLHRYGAHKMFTMSKFWERFFHLFTWVTQGSSYLNPRAYAIMHRMHHAYSDTDKDPHSPHFFKEVFSMMWKTKVIYNGFTLRKIKPDSRFDKNYPVWPSLDRIAAFNPTRLFFGLLYILFYIKFVPDGMWWMYAFLPIHFLMGPIHGAIVNWAGHKYGYRNYNDGDKSRNTLIIDFLMMGELFQNNHHHYAARSNFATKWWEVDPVYPVILVLNKVRVIRIRKEG